jgi:hypothetical protein
MTSTTGSLTATGSVTLIKDVNDTTVTTALSGDHSGMSFKFEGSTDGDNYFPLAATRVGTYAAESGTITPTGNQAWTILAAGWSYVQATVTAISSGTATFTLQSATYLGLPNFDIQTAAQAITNAITDPGASGAIPVANSGYVPLVTAGAETRTIAAPTFSGQELLLYMKTNGGNCVITCSTTVNETGNNTITFDNTGESCRLVGVEEGSNRRWRLTAVDGAALTTV